MNGETLKVLNLEGCQGLVLGRWDVHQHHMGMVCTSAQYRSSYIPDNSMPIQPIINKCTQLIEVNFGHIGLSHASIEYLVKNLTPTVEKLCLGGLKRLNDLHLKVIQQNLENVTKEMTLAPKYASIKKSENFGLSL